MRNSLRVKFLLLLVGVALVALSGTVVLRSLMLSDFRDFLEGETEDKVYALLANVEGAYEKDSGWRVDRGYQFAIWSLASGFEMRLRDESGRLIASSTDAVEQASPALKRRLAALSQLAHRTSSDPYTPYPLFLEGRQIGTVELRYLRQTRESLFVGRADIFLLVSVIILGGLALLIGILFSSRLIRPINDLVFAASALSKGDFKRRVAISRRDELGELGTAFNRMADGLETQESLRRKLVADVAHELRTPLGIMRGEIEAMIDGLMPIDEKRLQSLHDETGRLKRMVEGIEDLNQAETSLLYLKQQRVRLRPFFSDIVDRFRAGNGRKASIELQCPEDLEVEADPERLSQIVVNLVSNALRATSEGGRVSILVRNAGNGVSIIVRDSGAGIREEDLPFVFERFYRGPGGGLGIGLTIVKELVEAHGGTIEVESLHERGSTFTVSLPLRGIHNSS